MKWIVLAAVAVFGILYYYHTQHPYDPNRSQPVVYTKSLQNDIKKADATAQKATDAIDLVNQETQKAVQAGENQGQ